eukprot:1865967-Rhodomonas_salina.1
MACMSSSAWASSDVGLSVVIMSSRHGWVSVNHTFAITSSVDSGAVLVRRRRVGRHGRAQYVFFNWVGSGTLPSTSLCHAITMGV